MEILVQGETCCWICGRHESIVGSLTGHHTLPKHLRPKKNFIAPICKECHIEINKSDLKGLVAFAYKIQKSFDELGIMVGNMIQNLKSKK